MIFNSLVFVVFFAIILLLDRLLRSWGVRKVALLAAGYVFYAAWNPSYVWLLMGMTLVNWGLSRWMGPLQPERRFVRKLVLILGMTLNLSVLIYFKYADFMVQNLEQVLSWAGASVDFPSLGTMLPLAISFCTFEAIAYIVDVYRGDHQPNDSLLDFGLYISFFPHLVAGPIVRPNDFLPQLLAPNRATGQQFGWGLFLVTVGLFQKVILADGLLSAPASYVFSQPDVAQSSDVWTGVFAFACQILYDFAGYSNCAIGTAWCFGIELKPNFHCPYAAIGFSDFWRRWHISLSTWLRDYLYIPLGGNRHGPWLTTRNLLLTMLLGGLWHGAAWNFLIWGGLHGLFLILERGVHAAWGGRSLGLLGQACAWGMTFLGVCIGWLFFRATDVESAVIMLRAMTGQTTATTAVLTLRNVQAVYVVLMGTLVTHWWLRQSSLAALVDRTPWWFWAAACSFMWGCLALYGGDEATFLYFQF